MATFVSLSDNSRRFLEKPSGEYFHHGFDPLEDYTVQTIYSKLAGSSSDVAKDEAISVVHQTAANRSVFSIPF